MALTCECQRWDDEGRRKGTRYPHSFGRIGVPDEHGDAEFIHGPFNTDGVALETPEQVVAALEAATVVVTEAESTEINGINTMVVDVASSATRPVLKLRSDDIDQIGWWAPSRGRLWLLEHPDRGMLMITIGADEEIDTEFPRMLARTETMLASLEFIDLD